MSEASDFLDGYAILIPNGHRSKLLGPGQAFLSLSQERQEMLKTLKSSDWDNLRPDFLWFYPSKKRKGRWGL